MATLTSRAVLRQVEPGTVANCEFCDEPVKFQASKKNRQVLCNLYGRNGDPAVWDRLEQYHEQCYQEIGEPYGPADASFTRPRSPGFSKRL